MLARPAATLIRVKISDRSFCSVGFVVIGLTGTGQQIPLASVAFPIVDYKRTLVTGKRLIKLWTCQSDLDTIIPEENPDEHAAVLHVVFDSYALPVRASIPTWNEVVIGEWLRIQSPARKERVPTLHGGQVNNIQKEKLRAIETLDSLHEYDTYCPWLLTIKRKCFLVT